MFAHCCGNKLHHSPIRFAFFLFSSSFLLFLFFRLAIIVLFLAPYFIKQAQASKLVYYYYYLLVLLKGNELPSFSSFWRNSPLVLPRHHHSLLFLSRFILKVYCCTFPFCLKPCAFEAFTQSFFSFLFRPSFTSFPFDFFNSTYPSNQTGSRKKGPTGDL